MSTPRAISVGDSSDEEIPVPTFKCSALTNALLNDTASSTDQPVSRPKRISPELKQKFSASRGGSVDWIDQCFASNIINESSQYPRRIVRLSRAPGCSAYGRSKSVSVVNPEQDKASGKPSYNLMSLSTPAPVLRRIVRLPASIENNSKSTSIRDSKSSQNDGEVESLEYPTTVPRFTLPSSQGSVSKCAQPIIGRTRNGEDAGVKKIAGAFMSVRPRRGRRRRSDEEQSPADENFVPPSQDSEKRELQREAPQNYNLKEFQKNDSSPLRSQNDSGSPVNPNIALDSAILSKPMAPPITRPDSSRSTSPIQVTKLAVSQHSVIQGNQLHSNLLSRQLQENKPNLPINPIDKIPTAQLENIEKLKAQYHELVIPKYKAKPSSERTPLAPRNQNTPRRLASPPPKMTLIDTVTNKAGAATTSNPASKRNRIKMNGKIFTRLDCIGRGGSSRVYRVMAENSKFFALKKVSLENADESAIIGFKGEIDLLKKLEGVERVIRLYDYELNESKSILSVLMELGELDMNKILEVRLKSDNSKFDPSFVRHYWKEMLECLQAIHAHDVVHSDLKPHNFVLVQGQLKLIDFGIANAIQTDETVNVHRETQIGTPNYMSPESLIDSNAKPDANGRIQNAPKLMKLGKPSDIWSLGCILYQMTYGRAPFAHIQNQMQRCHAIINFNYPIEYRSVGIGNVPVPASLIKTLKKCLNRDQSMRPSATELLYSKDPFLNPVELDEDAIPMTEELLGRILLNAAAKFKDRTPTDAELFKLWPQGYFERLRKCKKQKQDPAKKN
ncbi:putative checkpoint protein [Erysiphe neolycopersici]|uniref:Putative checkpoint protein n=1 Tax=Erysiphe neolycopersici TaxID=212602 RepID=A0A420HBK7_9PEZI|nr:putative checkpoint protein [Erysiphe neolycopersici]